MNKIKLMYDLITTLKDKEEVNGSVKIKGTKDDVAVITFENEFEKDAATGQVKTKIRTEVGQGEQKFRHESTTEFNLRCCKEQLSQMHGSVICHHPPRPIRGEMKERLNRLAFMLHTLNSIQAEEQPDGYVELSLDLMEIPGHLRQCMNEQADRKMFQIHHEECGVIKELLTVENPQVTLRARVNPRSEIERIVLTFGGEQREEGGDAHVMNLYVEVNLNW